jgi:hypothetical protein
MLIIFDEVSLDEHPYLNWIRANPQGFVANVGRNLEGVFLHQATCSHITSPNVAKKGFIGPQYYKICASSSEGHVLVRWLKRLHSAGLCGEVYDHRYGQCQPHLIGKVKHR